MPPKRKASSSHLAESPTKRLTRSVLCPELAETTGPITRSLRKLTSTPSTPIRTPREIRTYSENASAHQIAQNVRYSKENEKLGQATSRDEAQPEVSEDELDMLSPTKTSVKSLNNRQPWLGAKAAAASPTMRTRGKPPDTPLRRPTKRGQTTPTPRSETPQSENEDILLEPNGRSEELIESPSRPKRRGSLVKPQATPSRISPRKKPLAAADDSNFDYTNVRSSRMRAIFSSRQVSVPQTGVSYCRTEDGSPSPSKMRNTTGNPSSTFFQAALERSSSPAGSQYMPTVTPLTFDDVPLTSMPISTLPPVTPKRKVPNLSSHTNIPRVLPNHLHPYFFAQKRNILQAIQQPLDVIDHGLDDDENKDPSTNEVAAEQLTDLLSGTINRGEGNSCLILGPKGSGKSRLVEKCISSFSEHNPLVIRLSGWTQHSDRLAMREIAHQLSQQTGTSFLPQGTDVSEDVEVDDERQDDLIASECLASAKITPAAHLPSLISLLPTLNRPTIVILDGFDLFTLHPRQALLYCLLDTAQSCRAAVGTKGLAVIGVTSRIDTIVHLEKRVKSRFSGRMIRTAPPCTVQDWQSIMKAILTWKNEEFLEDQIPGDDGAEWHGIWTTVVEQFLHDRATQNIWSETFGITRDVRMLTRILLSLVLRLSPSSFSLSATQVASAAAVQRVRPHFPLLYTLPYPAICLLIASVHADTAGQPVFTFEMLYESFRDQVRASTSAPVQVRGASIGMVRCSRQVLMIAFENLVAMRTFVPVVAYAQSVAKEFVKYRSIIEREDVKKAVEKIGQVNLKKWLTKATQ